MTNFLYKIRLLKTNGIMPVAGIYKLIFIILLAVLLNIQVLPAVNQPPQELLSKAQNSINIKEKIEAYSGIIKFYNSVMPDSALAYSLRAVKIAKNANYLKGEADILYLASVSCYVQSNFSEALDYCRSAFDIRRELKDNKGIGECLSRMGLIYNVKGEFEKAIDYCQQAVSILEEEGDKKELGEAYNHLGIIYYILGDIPRAIEICNKGLEICEKADDELVLAVSHEHLGIIYIKLKDYEKALYHTWKSIELREKHNDIVDVSGAYDNLGVIYRILKDYDKALFYFNKSIVLKKESNSLKGMASSLYGIGVTYADMGLLAKSKSYFYESYYLRRKVGDKRGMVSALNKLAETFSKLGNYQKAFEYYKEAKLCSDTLLNEEKFKAIAEFQEAFQKNRRDKEIQNLQRENALQRNIKNSVIIISIVVTLLAVSLFVAYGGKKKMNKILVNRSLEINKQKEELESLNKRLMELVTTRDKFFSILAHDLKSPFQGFLGVTEFLAEQGESLSPEELRKFGVEMNKNANNLFSLLRNLLEWSEMQRGSFDFNPEQLSVTGHILKNMENMKNRCEQKGIEMEYTKRFDGEIIADERMFDSVLLNLLSNAVKFTTRGGKINISSASEGGYVKISVADNGVGISSEMLEKLFIVGEKTGSTGTEGELSTGLGLLLCKEFVEKNGGSIGVESELGKGSIFFFTLPAAS
jgi:signal transduction histidine kinase